MNADAIVRRLEAFPGIIAKVLDAATEGELRTRSPSGAWSILEVLCHLIDEEELDFRARLSGTLNNAAATWPPIDPEGWARERRYNEQDPRQALERFAAARAESIRWLRSLGAVDWATAHKHPKFGPIKAGDLLAAWAAHDALHLRQMAKRLYEWAASDAPGFSTRYAGDWGP